MRLSMGRIFIYNILNGENKMKKISEHYFIITQSEITPEMEIMENGLYCLNNDIYEVLEVTKGKPSTTAITQLYHNNGNATFTQQSFYRKTCFVVAVLLISMFVLFLYLGIAKIDAYNEGIKRLNSLSQSNGNNYNDFFNQIMTSVDKETREKLVDEFLKPGILWCLGGIICFFVGIALTNKYDKYLATY